MTNQSELVTEAAINAAIKARWFYANKVLFTSGSISLDDSTRIQLTAAICINEQAAFTELVQLGQEIGDN